MNELQRQAYIEAMGVDSYFPRFTLPGAAVSELCEIPSEFLQSELAAVETAVITDDALNSVQADSISPVENSVATAAVKGSAGNGSAAAMQALFADDNKRKEYSADKTLAATSSVEPVNTDGDIIPEFSLSIIRGANILLVDEGLNGNVDQVEYLTLLHNMLFALGAEVQQLSIERFNWPMVKSAQFDQTALAAKQTLQAFIAKQLSQLDSSYLLVMGESAKTYLAAELTSDNEKLSHGRFMSCKVLESQLICTHSASAMLINPELKREIWKDLQPLHRVLKKS